MIEIKKAKIIEGTFLELEYTLLELIDGESAATEIKGLFKKRIHDDLVEAFNRLKVHVAFLSEMEEIPNSIDENSHNESQFLNYKATKISISGNEDGQGVTITGQRRLKSKKVLNLNTPFTKFIEQSGVDNYPFLSELKYDVLRCVEEVEAYLNGKHAPNPQMQLELN